MNDETPKPKPKSKYRYRPPASRRAGKGGRPGKARFIPDANQRHVVLSCAAMRMTRAEIAQLIRNPHTGEPIGLRCFDKVFKTEMETGYNNLKSTIATQYAKDLEKGKEYAVRLGLRNRFAWVNEGQQAPAHLLLGNGGGVDEIQITSCPDRVIGKSRQST
jgi:hypothetical protein